MGTRHLTAVFIGGEYKVAQYGQWDGYPDGQGIDALEFLRNSENRAKLAENAKKCRWLNSEDDAAIENAGDNWKGDWGHLSRDHGAGILAIIAGSPNGLPLANKLAFAADSLFCEWAWVVDFDKGTFEAYEGFNQEPLKEGERFLSVEAEADADKKYYPVRFRASWPLDDLPSDEDFLKAFAEKEEEATA